MRKHVELAENSLITLVEEIENVESEKSEKLNKLNAPILIFDSKLKNLKVGLTSNENKNINTLTVRFLKKRLMKPFSFTLRFKNVEFQLPKQHEL